MKAWIADVVGDGASVDAKGKFLVQVPWSTNGELSPSNKRRVIDWLRTASSAARDGWVIAYRDNAWWVNLEKYPTAAAVIEQIGAWPMSKPK